MKYIFLFDEINHGRIIINSDHTPSDDEVIDAVMNGVAYYYDTEYGNVRLAETDSTTPKKEQEKI